MPRHPQFRPAPLALAIALTLALPAAALAQSAAAPIALSIPSQPLAQALNDWSRQTGIPLVAPQPLLAGKTAPAVSGLLDARQALDRLLAGSGLLAMPEGKAMVIHAAPAPPAGDAGMLGTVTVTAAREQSPYGPGVGYVAERSAAGTKTDAPILTTPQSISVVTREQMDEQQAQFFGDALRYTAGVVSEPYARNNNGTNPNLFLRGFSDPTSVFVDGLSVNSGSPFDAYFFDRMEIVGGPASVLYGQGNPGGILNMASKRPTAEPLHELVVGLGSPSRRQLAFDFGGPLNADATLTYRLTGLAGKQHMDVDFVNNEQRAIAPALAWKPDAATSFTLMAKYLDRPNKGSQTGAPLYGSRFPNPLGQVSPSTNFSNPAIAKSGGTYKSVGYEFKKQINDRLKLESNGSFSNEVGNNTFVTNGTLLPDMRTLQRGSLFDFVVDYAKYSLIDNHAIYKADFGGVSSETLAGFDYKRTHNKGNNGSAPLRGGIDIFDPVYEVIDVASVITPDRRTTEEYGTTQKGLYLQEQMRWGQWTLIGSGRYDRFESYYSSWKIAPGSYNRSDRPTQNKFTYRVGGSYLIGDSLAPYVSYSTSFKPENGKDFYGAMFEPTQGKQTEIGIKYQPVDRNLLITAAVYDLRKTNVTTGDPDHPGFSKQIAGVRSRGLELSARGGVTRDLDVIASYSYTDAKNTNTNSFVTGTVGGAKVPLEGKRPTYVPRHSASLWASYRWSGTLRGLTTSAGVRYVGSTPGDTANSYSVPSATLVDLALNYDFGAADSRMAGWSASVNVSNLFNRTTFTCSGNQCQFRPERTIYAAARYRW